MTANEFRKSALALPDAVEQSHMNHPDFRVGGKIFATLGRDEAWGMVKLTKRFALRPIGAVCEDVNESNLWKRRKLPS
jgi:predicted DNA-binding protein (MmcQ/YjbR family)